MKSLYYPIATLIILLSLACGAETTEEQEDCFYKVSRSSYIQGTYNVSSMKEAWDICREEETQIEVKEYWDSIPMELKQ